MSEPRSATPAAEVDPEFEAIADRLYAERPEGFAAARDDEVRKAKAEKRQALARDLGKLRKPTQSAWLINLLWRDQHDVVEQLFELAGELSAAQARAAGEELRHLTAQRRELEVALLRQAEALAEKAGVKPSESTLREAQETLSAALADPAVADEVRTGRLVKPAAYAGFGFLPSPGAAPAARPPEPPRPAQKRAEAARASSAEAAGQTDSAAEAAQAGAEREAAERQARQRRQAAELRVRQARTAVDAANRVLAERKDALEAAQREQRDLREQVDRLQEQLRRLEQRATSADQNASAAETRRDEATEARGAALAELERAQKDLEDA
jgi:DNA repair exonuclease SbcCD ATPase subunit